MAEEERRNSGRKQKKSPLVRGQPGQPGQPDHPRKKRRDSPSRNANAARVEHSSLARRRPSDGQDGGDGDGEWNWDESEGEDEDVREDLDYDPEIEESDNDCNLEEVMKRKKGSKKAGGKGAAKDAVKLWLISRVPPPLSTTASQLLVFLAFNTKPKYQCALNKLVNSLVAYTELLSSERSAESFSNETASSFSLALSKSPISSLSSSPSIPDIVQHLRTLAKILNATEATIRWHLFQKMANLICMVSLIDK